MNTDFLESLEFNFGPEIMAAFADPSVLEIMLNDDGKVWIERFGREMEQLSPLNPSLALNVFQLLATGNHVTVGEHRPSLQAALPPEKFGGARFQGYLPPVADRPTFCIRKRPTRVFTLADYVSGGILSEKGAEVLREAVLTHKNIVVVGGTGSGKTTFVNALQHELFLLCPQERQLVLEDTREIQSDNPNTVYLTATDMFDILAGSRFNGGDDDEAKDRASYILDCDLLIIDDLGTELINTFTASQMFYCVNERLNRNKNVPDGRRKKENPVGDGRKSG